MSTLELLGKSGLSRNFSVAVLLFLNFQVLRITGMVIDFPSANPLEFFVKPVFVILLLLSLAWANMTYSKALFGGKPAESVQPSA